MQHGVAGVEEKRGGIANAKYAASRALGPSQMFGIIEIPERGQIKIAPLEVIARFMACSEEWKSHDKLSFVGWPSPRTSPSNLANNANDLQTCMSFGCNTDHLIKLYQKQRESGTTELRPCLAYPSWPSWLPTTRLGLDRLAEAPSRLWLGIPGWDSISFIKMTISAVFPYGCCACWVLRTTRSCNAFRRRT